MSRAKPLNDAQKQIQSELFTLTYGVLVAQILEDVEEMPQGNILYQERRGLLFVLALS